MDVILTHETFSAPDGTGASRFVTGVCARRIGLTLVVTAATMRSVPRPGDRFHGGDVLTVIEATTLPGGREYRCQCMAAEAK